MKYNAVLGIMIVLVFLMGNNLRPDFAEANQAQSNENYKKADLKNGALLYDNWTKITDTKPKGTHPLYPAEAKKSGISTWRCKECHGWDYIGNKGRYSKGSHFTGISGVFQKRNASPETLYNFLTDKESGHDFSKYITQEEIWDLVKFLREGQVSIESVINEKNLGRGDISKGKNLYNAKCSSCHGMDGDKIDFKYKKDGLQGVGWLAVKNPQESIHKIRWGHPGSNMPSLIVDEKLSEQDAIDILTYSQSL